MHLSPCNFAALPGRDLFFRYCWACRQCALGLAGGHENTGMHRSDRSGTGISSPCPPTFRCVDSGVLYYDPSGYAYIDLKDKSGKPAGRVKLELKNPPPTLVPSPTPNTLAQARGGVDSVTGENGVEEGAGQLPH